VSIIQDAYVLNSEKHKNLGMTICKGHVGCPCGYWFIHKEVYLHATGYYTWRVMYGGLRDGRIEPCPVI